MFGYPGQHRYSIIKSKNTKNWSWVWFWNNSSNNKSTSTRWGNCWGSRRVWGVRPRSQSLWGRLCSTGFSEEEAKILNCDKLIRHFFPMFWTIPLKYQSKVWPSPLRKWAQTLNMKNKGYDIHMWLCLFHRLCLLTCKDEKLADKKKKGVPHQQSPSSQESTTKLKTMQVS